MRTEFGFQTDPLPYRGGLAPADRPANAPAWLCTKSGPFLEIVRGHRPRLQICNGLTVGAVYDRAHSMVKNDFLCKAHAWPGDQGQITGFHRNKNVKARMDVSFQGVLGLERRMQPTGVRRNDMYLPIGLILLIILLIILF